MTKIYYVTTFRQLKLGYKIKGHFELSPGINISNDPSVKDKFLDHEFARAAGVVEFEHLMASPHIVFGEFKEEDLPNMPPDKFLLAMLLFIKSLFRNAWLLKDHAMQCDAAFLAVKAQGEIAWHSNFISGLHSFSDGTRFKDIRMSRKDVLEWKSINDLVEGYSHKTNSSDLNFMLDKNFARTARALRFVNHACQVGNTAFKIAHYCSAFESLFTTDSAELSHKLAERIALFLWDYNYEPKTVFKDIKAAYSVRSKLVHGDTLKPQQVDDLPVISAKCDQYLRHILSTIFHSEDLRKVFDSHNNALEEYFLNLLFLTQEE